ncbi:hypothetical protein ZHAS_00014990 [Anopheles sinensis]|uniref:Uncharacterized protein n=1 Tax=Anopheles sinensis TaxID=74873 RepID=A0A084W9T7_ANOSI|nr:hypothetical protein ZHAS_00014990 [Anopheles sinensis]
MTNRSRWRKPWPDGLQKRHGRSNPNRSGQRESISVVALPVASQVAGRKRAGFGKSTTGIRTKQTEPVNEKSKLSRRTGNRLKKTPNGAGRWAGVRKGHFHPESEALRLHLLSTRHRFLDHFPHGFPFPRQPVRKVVSEATKHLLRYEYSGANDEPGSQSGRNKTIKKSKQPRRIPKGGGRFSQTVENLVSGRGLRAATPVAGV